MIGLQILTVNTLDLAESSFVFFVKLGSCWKLVCVLCKTNRFSCIFPPVIQSYMWRHVVWPTIGFPRHRHLAGFFNWSKMCANEWVKRLRMCNFTIKDFVFGNERTRVTCRSCEARNAYQRFTRDSCPFISQCKQKSELQSLIVKLNETLSFSSTVYSGTDETKFTITD